MGSLGWDKEDAYGMKDISRADIEKNMHLVSKKEHPHQTIVNVGCGDKENVVAIGGDNLVIMAGPCAVTTEEDLMIVAENVKKAGAHMLRGGAYKPLTFPHKDPSKQVEGLKFLRAAGDKFQLPVVTEVLDPRDVEVVGKYADMFQIGARNMSNYPLLREVGKHKKPVLLKRHMGLSLRDWLGAAEHIMKEGNTNIVLCERGISVPHTHDPNARFIMDVQAIPAAKLHTHLPVIADPSHSTFNRKLVAPMARAAVGAGADGIIIDVSRYPEQDPVDPLQALGFEDFSKLVQEMKIIGSSIGRTI